MKETGNDDPCELSLQIMSSCESKCDIKSELKKQTQLSTEPNINISKKGSMIGSEVSKMVEQEAPDLLFLYRNKGSMAVYELKPFMRNSETN